MRFLKSNLIGIAKAQNISKFLDSIYFPLTEEEGEEEEELFNKKVYVFFFKRVIKTDERKAFIRQYENGYNAQSVFQSW